jgi:transglutaminase-like putative cysteine protease
MSRLDDPGRWTGRTRLIDLGHPAIQQLAARLAEGRSSARERAVAAHDHVSRTIRFGFRPAFHDLSASQVLQGGVGFCNNQSTLMVALLRALGVPARAHYVDIHAGVLGGVLNPGTPYVDHSWTEAFIDGAWRRTDSYIVDPPLLAAVQPRLRREQRALGWGAHVNGTTRWDGRTDAFSQFLDDGAEPRLSTRDYGLFDDAAAFYAAPGERWNRLNPVMSVALLLSAKSANARIDAVRQGRA